MAILLIMLTGTVNMGEQHLEEYESMLDFLVSTNRIISWQRSDKNTYDIVILNNLLNINLTCGPINIKKK